MTFREVDLLLTAAAGRCEGGVCLWEGEACQNWHTYLSLS